jgi:D-alanyl-D-alanine carboxypeptidase (penicillin-binding protein 5/6)
LLAVITATMPAPAPAHLPVSSITLDAATFAVIHQHNADIARQPASLTKLMTAYAAYGCVEENGGVGRGGHHRRRGCACGGR